MLEWLGANPWSVWLVLAGVLAVSEMLTLDLTLLMLAVGALAGGAVGLIVPGLIWLQIVVALAVAVAMLALLRPLLLNRLRSSPGYRNSTDKLVGSEGVALGEITARGGEVKIGPDIWTARSYDASTIADGTDVDVLEIDGAIAVVHPRFKPLSP